MASQQGPEPQPVAISVREAAKLLGISYITAKRYVLTGELPSIKLGARRLVPVAAIRDMLATAGRGAADDR
jgi:excisionase family DNA binding protein